MNKFIFILIFNIFTNFIVLAQQNDSKFYPSADDIAKLLDSARVYVSNRPVKSIVFSEEALKKSEQSDYYLGETLSLKLLAAAYRNLDNYSKALELLFKTLELDKKNGSDINLATCYNDIGLIYYRINNYNKALENYLIGLKYGEKSKNLRILSNLYNNIGSAYHIQGQFILAEENLLKALEIFEKTNDSTGMARLLNNLGYLSETAGNNNSALNYYQKALDIKLKFNNKLDIANTMQNLASIHLALQNPDKSIELLLKSLTIAEEINNKKLISDAYLLLTLNYFFKRDEKQSLRYKNLYFKISEEIKREDQARKIAELLVKNKIEQKDKENIYLSRLTKVQKYYFLLVAVILVIVIITLISMNKKKKNVNIQLRESSQQLKSRIRFIEFLSNSSTNLINVNINEIDNSIIHALQFISEFTEQKFTALFNYFPNSKLFSLKQKYVNPDIVFDIENIEINENTEEILSPLLLDKPVTYFTADKSVKTLNDLIDEEIKSIILIPIKIDGKLWGIIAAGSSEKHISYNDELINIFTLTGEMLANAVKRKINEERLVFYSKELEEINRSKDRFYSMVSHDLKSPFQGLLGLASFIISEADSLSKDEIKEFVGNIESSAKNLYGLLENLLNWTRFELGRIQFTPESFYLYDLLEEVENILLGIAKKKGIEIKLDVDKDFTMIADRKMMYSILSNLITNGIKFTKANGYVTVAAKKTASNVILTVTDNGIGMTKEQIDNLFDITNINSTPGTNNEKGTGLGLLLCGEMVEKHNGNIEITSSIEKGTCFIISIPQ